MSAEAFADLIGVHYTTVYRWERYGPQQPNIDPHQMRILLTLQKEVNKREDSQAEAFGKGIATAILTGGSLFGLYKLLAAAYGGDT
tara:strand:+ start:955 stop:1212 length:258 start_codon:yes stop_codon:yes gene_type:complete